MKPRRTGVTQLTVPNPIDLQGRTLFDGSGEGIGVVEGVYLDNTTRVPEWAAVRIGPEALALVPLAEASATREGAQVPYSRDEVVAAPFHLTGLDNEVTEDTENQLYAYYGEADGSTSDDGSEAAQQVKEVAATAKDQAADVAATAKDQATDVAATAKDQAADVAASAKDQAADVVAAAKDNAAGVVERAREETAQVVHVATDEARELIETTRSELESQAESQLDQLAETLRRTAGQALALARGNPDQAGPLGDLVGRAGEELQSVAVGIDERGSQGLLEDAQRVVRQRPRAAIFGTALAVVAGARLMGTPAGEKVKQKLAPLKEQAVEAGRNLAHDLTPIAQEKADRVKSIAVGAVDQVKTEAQDTAQEVKGTATRATRTVKGTAKASATTVKGTAKRSSATVKTTAKRTAKASAPVV
jgi:hypothetical protein